MVETNGQIPSSIKLHDITIKNMEERRRDREESLPEIQARLDAMTSEERAKAFLAQKRQTERAESWAKVDPLTTLPRKEVFLLHTTDEMARVDKNPENRVLRIGIADIDGFGKFNKKYGELVGDDVLSGVGKRLRESTRSRSDIATRYGGEEFAIVMPSERQTSTFEQRVVSAERIRAAAGTILEDKNEEISMSFGTTEYTPGETYESFFSRASRAQRVAKRLGKNRTVSAIVTDQGEEYYHDLSTGKIYLMSIPNPKKQEEFDLEEKAA